MLVFDARHDVVPASLLEAVRRAHERIIPSFSRQTKLACSVCHYQFPQLTPFGRLFKMNGYTLTSLQVIRAPGDTGGTGTLALAPIPPASAMVVASLTRTSAAQPETQNNTVSFPQQFSLFLGGQVTPNVGAFTQFTYTGADGAFGIDNVDIRFAKRLAIGSQGTLVGLTLHNNPTVQDPWNTAPAWSWPFMSSEVAPSPAASTLVEGALGQQVLGLGAYSLLGGTVYAELTAYRSAPQGSHQPLDSTAVNTIRELMPYWRVALQHQFAPAYVMIGTFGTTADLYPTGISGPTNRYTDIGADAQVEHPLGSPLSPGALIGRVSYVHESQRLDAFVNANPAQAVNTSGNLSSVHASVSLEPSTTYGFTAGYFQVSGTSDALHFPSAALTGSRTGSPNSAGFMGEISVNPWQNTRVGVQYVAYNRFNGSSSAYDVPGGRNASDNNTLYLFTWVAF